MIQERPKRICKSLWLQKIMDIERTLMIIVLTIIWQIEEKREMEKENGTIRSLEAYGMKILLPLVLGGEYAIWKLLGRRKGIIGAIVFFIVFCQIAYRFR